MLQVPKTLELPTQYLEPISKIYQGFYSKSLHLMIDMIFMYTSLGSTGSRGSCLQEIRMEFIDWLGYQLCICKDTYPI